MFGIMKKYLEIIGVSKSFGNSQILKDINIAVNKGEFVVLFGPNGCGKTTLLNIIAGITLSDCGEVKINGKTRSKENIGYVFQNYRDSLLPWKKNIENITFPLELKNVPRKKRLLKAKRLVKELGLNMPLHNFPYQSSGGEQQLIAILREVIASPRLILLDEPFSSLDNDNRNYLRIKIQEILKKFSLACLFVSHDITEAIQLADRIILFGNNPAGVLQEIKIRFKRPRTEEVIYNKKFQFFRNAILSRYANENK